MEVIDSLILVTWDEEAVDLLLHDAPEEIQVESEGMDVNMILPEICVIMPPEVGVVSTKMDEQMYVEL